MGGAIQFEPPRDRATLLAALESASRQGAELFEGLDAEQFFAHPAGPGWSPAENVAHLATSTNIITLSLNLPRLLPRALFGVARRPGRSYEEIRDKYRAALAGGAGAGPFAPRRRRPKGDLELRRAKALAKWDGLVPALNRAIDRWSDADLDRYRLLHPILGRLSVREMLYFTLYHLSHHLNVVAVRLALCDS